MCPRGCVWEQRNVVAEFIAHRAADLHDVRGVELRDKCAGKSLKQWLGVVGVEREQIDDREFCDYDDPQAVDCLGWTVSKTMGLSI